MSRLMILAVGLLLMAASAASAITIDEIIKLKQAGVSDGTIQMLIERDGSARAAGTWRTQDGWIIHTTEVFEPHRYFDHGYRSTYPIVVFPEVSIRRRVR